MYTLLGRHLYSSVNQTLICFTNQIPHCVRRIWSFASKDEKESWLISYFRVAIMQNPNEDTEWNDVLRAKGIIPEKPKEAEVTLSFHLSGI